MDIINDRRPRHRWTMRDRQVLCLFSVRKTHVPWVTTITFSQRLYENSIEDATRFINHLCSEDLTLEGYPKGLPIATVQAMLHSMSEGAAGYATWETIHIVLSISEARKSFREIRDTVEDTALVLGISLHLRAEECQKGKTHPHRKPARKKEKIRSVLDDHYSSSDNTESEMQRNSSRKRVLERIQGPATTPQKRVKTQLLTPRSDRSLSTTSRSGRRSWTMLTKGIPTPLWQNVDGLGNKGRWYPRLLYRSYSRRSQGLNTPMEIRASKFLDTSRTIPPPAWDFAAVANHLIPQQQKSPYISFREGLLCCFFHALKEDKGAEACIAVIDHQKAKATTHEWGDEAIKRCRFLIDKFKMKVGGVKRNYTGSREWLFYGI